MRLTRLGLLGLALVTTACVHRPPPRISLTVPPGAGGTSGALAIAVTSLGADAAATELHVGLRVENRSTAAVVFDAAQLEVVLRTAHRDARARVTPLDPGLGLPWWSRPVVVPAGASRTGAVTLGIPSGELEQACELEWSYAGTELHRLRPPWVLPPECVCTAPSDAWKPKLTVAPVYPRREAVRRREGWTVTRFAVDADGRVREPRIVASFPAGVFDRASERALEQWLYARGSARAEVVVRLNFTLPKGRTCPPTGPCAPLQAPPVELAERQPSTSADERLRISAAELRTGRDWTDLHAALRIHNPTDAPLLVDPRELELVLGTPAGELRGRPDAGARASLLASLEPLAAPIRLEPHQTVARAAVIRTPRGALEHARSLRWVHAGASTAPARALWTPPEADSGPEATASSPTRAAARGFARLWVTLRPDGSVCRTQVGVSYPDAEVGSAAAIAVQKKAYPGAAEEREVMVLVEEETPSRAR